MPRRRAGEAGANKRCEEPGEPWRNLGSPGGVPLNLHDDERCGGGGGDPGRACAESKEGQKLAGVPLKEAPGGGGKRRDWGPRRPRLPDRRRG